MGSCISRATRGFRPLARVFDAASRSLDSAATQLHTIGTTRFDPFYPHTHSHLVHVHGVIFAWSSVKRR
jgi:hypothetical protein